MTGYRLQITAPSVEGPLQLVNKSLQAREPAGCDHGLYRAVRAFAALCERSTVSPSKFVHSIVSAGSLGYGRRLNPKSVAHFWQALQRRLFEQKGINSGRQHHNSPAVGIGPNEVSLTGAIPSFRGSV